MSIETEVKAAEQAVVEEAKAVEGAVAAEVTKVEEKVAEVVKRYRVEIEAVESLFLRTAETEFLRGQVTIRDLQVQMKDAMEKSEAASKKYAVKMEELVVKYGINKVEQIFDNIENVFKANPSTNVKN